MNTSYQRFMSSKAWSPLVGKARKPNLKAATLSPIEEPHDQTLKLFTTLFKKIQKVAYK